MRYMKYIGLLFVFLGYYSTVNASLNKEDLNALTDAVKSMCVHPDRVGDYLKIEGGVSGGAVLKVIGAEVEGKITHETWDGINQRLDKYKVDPRQCSIEILKILIPSFHE